jgi:hypothetical protein
LSSLNTIRKYTEPVYLWVEQPSSGSAAGVKALLLRFARRTGPFLIPVFELEYFSCVIIFRCSKRCVSGCGFPPGLGRFAPRFHTGVCLLFGLFPRPNKIPQQTQDEFWARLTRGVCTDVVDAERASVRECAVSMHVVSAPLPFAFTGGLCRELCPRVSYIHNTHRRLPAIGLWF